MRAVANVIISLFFTSSLPQTEPDRQTLTFLGVWEDHLSFLYIGMTLKVPGFQLRSPRFSLSDELLKPTYSFLTRIHSTTDPHTRNAQEKDDQYHCGDQDAKGCWVTAPLNAP